MEWSFIAGLFTGSLLTASFACWAAWHELRLKRMQ